MREVVLDTETTGLSPKDGHRIIEIGCVELIDKQLTGNIFHQYIKPERMIDPGAERVHGISSEFLEDKPLFAAVMEEFIEYVSGATLVIHNAKFDMGFLNHELKMHKKVSLGNEVIDTLEIARRKYPGQRVNLDALCKKLGVDNSARDKHGALLDAEILAFVYLKMTEAEQEGLKLLVDEQQVLVNDSKKIKKVSFPERNFSLTEEEIQAHTKMLSKLKNHSW